MQVLDARWAMQVLDARWAMQVLDARWAMQVLDARWAMQVLDARWAMQVLDARWAMSLRNKVLESCHTCEYVVYVNVNESCATHAAQRGIRSELGHVDTHQSARSFATAPAPAAHARNRRSRSSQILRSSRMPSCAQRPCPQSPHW